MSYLPSSPDLASIAGLMAKYPRCGILLFKLLEDIKSSFSPLSKGTRELIIAYVSDLNQSISCFNTHKALAKEMGIDELVFMQLRQDIDSANIEGKLKPILRFVNKLTVTPNQISQADIKPIYAAGWDERAFLDTVRLCAVVNCMNRFALGAGIDKATPPRKQTLADINPRFFYHS